MKTALPGYYSHPGPGQAGQPGFSNLPHSQASLAADPRSGHYGGEKQSGNTAYPAVNSNPGNSNGINNGLAGINYSGIQMNTTAGFGGDHGGFVNNNHQVARSNSSSSSSSSHSSGARSNTYSGNNTSMARTNSHAGSNNGNMDVYAANNTYARHNGHGANNMFANASPQSTPSYPTAVPHTATPYNEKSAMHQPNSSMWSATSSPSYAPDDSKRAMISASPVPEVMKKPEGEKAGWNGGAGVGSGKRDTVDMPPPPYLG
ncbi:hypothetical protein BC829DRAFT_382431 [Chytridium lagenaria]|nr:hypothetical protein BC829DRAFT_382431 [Chytridium lagenaria]